MAIGARYVSIADQGFNSLSNFAVVAFAAIAGSRAEFGRFAVAYAVFVFLFGAARALIGETAIVHESGAERTSDSPRALAATLSGAAVPVAAAGVLVMLALAAIMPSYAPIWCALAVATGAAILQDALRYAMLARHRPGRALVLDLVWTVPALGAMAFASTAGAGTVAVVLAWGVTAAVSFVTGMLWLAGLPSLRGGWRWMRSVRSSGVRFVTEFASLNGATLLMWTLLTPLLGPVGVGALRGAQLLFSPLNTVYTSLRIAMIPELVRAVGRNARRRRTVETGALLAGALVVWGAVIVWLPDEWGRSILGDTWLGAAGLRGEFLAQYAALAAYSLVLTLFRVDRRHGASSAMRGVLAVTTVVLPLAGAAAWQEQGAALGLAISVAAAAALGAVLLLRPPRPKI